MESDGERERDGEMERQLWLAFNNYVCSDIPYSLADKLDNGACRPSAERWWGNMSQSLKLSSRDVFSGLTHSLVGRKWDFSSITWMRKKITVITTQSFLSFTLRQSLPLPANQRPFSDQWDQSIGFVGHRTNEPIMKLTTQVSLLFHAHETEESNP